MSDYEKLHARIAQLVERNTGLAELANERGYEIDALKAENEYLRELLSRTRTYMYPSDPLRNLINATLISSPENP